MITQIAEILAAQTILNKLYSTNSGGQIAARGLIPDHWKKKNCINFYSLHQNDVSHSICG